MIGKIIERSVAHPVAVLFAALLLALAGVYGLLNTPRDAIPDLADVQVIVYTDYPGQAPQVVEGAIQGAQDVDVFKIEGKAGQTLVFEVLAARLGSPLDPIITLYDDKGQALARSDDELPPDDPRLEVKLPRDGAYYLSLIDAHDQGGPTHVYRLIVETKK